MGAVKKLVLYTPHDKQKEFHQCASRHRVISFGRQAGKSTAANNELLKKAWEKSGVTLWFISPTYDSARVMFRRATKALHRSRGLFRDNKSELMIEFINGSKIFYKSGEVLENLRTETLDGVVIDEVRNQHPSLWPLVIRPMLTTTGGWAVFISTPNGFDHFYDLYMFALSDKTGSWAAMNAPSTCNPLISEDEIWDAKRTMTEAEFAQEYLAEFRDLTAGRAYVNFSSGDNGNIRDTNPFYPLGIMHPGLPIILAMDFNITPMAWTLGQKKVDQFYWFDEIFLKQSHTQEAAEVIAQKIMPLNNKHGVIICGDATSKSSQRAAAGQSDYDILCQVFDKHGIKWVNMTPESNPQVKDRVNTVNSKLKDGNGDRHCWFHPDCKQAIKDMQRVVWKNGASGAMLDQTTDKERTHSSDGIGYAICELSPLVYKKGTSRISVINSPSVV